jgi:YD repeat-containing protein
MRARSLLLAGVACAVLLAGPSSQASENTVYVYDALGRLITSTRTGGPSSGVTMATCFDPAGNRSQYFVGTSGVPACATPAPDPTPTPTPTPTNHPPIAAADSYSVATCSETWLSVKANDSDPDGDPITLIAASNSGYYATPYVSDPQIDYWANNHNGTDTVTYTIQDSHGATATGTATINISGNPNCTGEMSKAPGGEEEE